MNEKPNARARRLIEADSPVSLSDAALDAIEQRVAAALTTRTEEAPAYTVAPAAESLTARSAAPDAAKLPEAWSTEDRQESKQEAERRWSRPVEREAEQRYQSGCINGFMLGAEWQKARETFISYKVIADEARSERDAALAAVERVRAAVNGPHPANSGLDSFTLAHISAALDGAPEPEVKPSSTVDEDVERCQWEHYDRRTAQTIGHCLSDAVDGAYCFRHLGTLARRVFYAVNVELQPLTYFAGESAFREWGTRADIWAERIIAAGKPPEPLPAHMKGKPNA